MTVTIPFFRNKTIQDNVTKQPRRIPRIDKTESLQCNKELTYGLYHNQYAGIRLGASLAYAPIAVPVFFMGLPTITSEDTKTNDRLKDLCKEFSLQMSALHTETHRDGTVWVFPFYSSSDRKLHWEYIPDESVTDIIRNIDTNEIIKIVTKESLVLSTGENTTLNSVRTRVFTKTKVTETFEGAVPDGELHKPIRTNVAGILPINFTNNLDLNEVRGHSDYERIISDLKDYHDIDLARSVMLAKYKTKMLINLASGSSLETFLSNNGYKDINDIDTAAMDLLIMQNQDTIDFKSPELSAYQAYSEALAGKFKKIVEASGVPEIAWGLKTTGNHATSDEQMFTLSKFIESKQDQKTEKYRILYKASLQILSIAEMSMYQSENIKVEWGRLDAVSIEKKAEILVKFATAIKTLVDGGVATENQIFELWKEYYPEETTETIQEFNLGLSMMAKYKQYRDASYRDTQDVILND